MVIEFHVLRNGFPVFSVASKHPAFKRVYGARYADQYATWLFPAAKPFCTRVLEDLKLLVPGVPLSDKALEYLENIDTPIPVSPLVPNYAHQDEAVAELLQFPRYGLFLDRGLGKTKVVVEAARALHQQDPRTRVLILALRVNLYTWVDEFERFTQGELTCAPFKSTVYVPKRLAEKAKELKEEARDKAEARVRRKNGPLPSNASDAAKRTRHAVVQRAVKKAQREALSGSYLARAEKLEKLVREQDPFALVVTYETASATTQALLDHFRYTIIVADESHRLRGHRTGITKAAHKLSEPAGRRWLVTGTPSLGDPLHVWGQYRFLGPFILPNFWEFRKRHVITAPNHDNFIIGYKNLDKLAELTGSLSLCKKSEEVLTMPDRVFTHHSIDPSAKQKSMYNSIIEDRVIVYDGNEVELEEPIVMLNKLAQLSAGFYYEDMRDPAICDGCEHQRSCVDAEIRPYTQQCSVVQVAPDRRVFWAEDNPVVVEATVELVKEHMAEGRKVVVWAKHHAILDKLFEELKGPTEWALSPGGEALLRYDSRATAAPHIVEKTFNTHPDAKVLLAQISMGIGVTFKAPAMVYAEVDWRLDFWLQSLDRNYGIRAKGFKRLLVDTVATRGSLTESTLNLLKEKRDVAELLARKPTCVGCDRVVSCLDGGVEPFDDACKWDKKTSLTKVRPQLL